VVVGRVVRHQVHAEGVRHARLQVDLIDGVVGVVIGFLIDNRPGMAIESIRQDEGIPIIVTAPGIDAAALAVIVTIRFVRGKGRVLEIKAVEIEFQSVGDPELHVVVRPLGPDDAVRGELRKIET
jgi:hypothetical protein